MTTIESTYDFAVKLAKNGFQPSPSRGGNGKRAKAPVSLIDGKKSFLWKHKQDNWVHPSIEEPLYDSGYIGIVNTLSAFPLVCIDVDTKHDPDGTLWSEVQGVIVNTLSDYSDQLYIEQTQSGGYHVYYNIVTSEGEIHRGHLAEIYDGDKKFALIECPPFTIIAPTPKYSVIQGDLLQLPQITWEEHCNFLEGLKRLDRSEKTKPKEPVHKPIQPPVVNNELSEYDRIQSVVDQLVSGGRDITNSYESWVKVGFSIASELGEGGRDLYHQVCSMYSGYSYNESDKKYTDAVKNGNRISIGTFYDFAKQAGCTIPPSKPKRSTTVKPKSSLPVKNKIAEQLEEEKPKPKPLFVAKSGKEWIEEAKERGFARKLWGTLWYEGEIHVLFGSTNTGKSLLAVQVGLQIASGKNLGLDIHETRMDSSIKAQKVLYFDLELSGQQFRSRYTDTQTKNIICEYIEDCENFLRVEIDTDSNVIGDRKEFEETLLDGIEETIKSTGAKVLIFDNLTYLTSDAEKGSFASRLMKHLKNLQRTYSLSLMLLGHTPKRDQSKPLTRNDLAGSSHIANFADSMTAINTSFSDPNYRYIKQIKTREDSAYLNTENIAVTEIRKDNAFTAHHFVAYQDEYSHLQDKTPEKVKEKAQKKNDALEMFNSGKTQGEIAKELGVGQGTVSKWLKSV